MWRYYNPNPCGRNEPDCAVRALCAALQIDWDTAHKMLCDMSREMCTMPSSDAAWGAILRQHGFVRTIIPSSCPDCYTVADFCEDFPSGTYVLALGGHVVTVRDGVLLDSYDTSAEIPVYMWMRRR